MNAAAPAEPLLTVEGLSRQYGDLAALRDASFTIRRGEVLGLIGPNGSGKTTLFECVAGVRPATRGDVSAGGRLVPPAERKRLLYYVPDGVHPWPGQTVGWALRFAASLGGTSDQARDGVVRDLGLGVLLPSRLSTLSKGEHKRVLVALGLMSSQPLLMLDEPFDGLDLRQTRDVMQVLRSHAGRTGHDARTLFLSIHQLDDAARICDRLVLLSGGRVAGRGTLDELRAAAGRPAGTLEEVFLALT